MTKFYYAGIGSRRTPPDVCDIMTKLARWLAEKGLILRSGGADGADSAFEKGAGEAKEIFLPWKMYNRNGSKLFPPTDDAIRLASEFHPAWHNCYGPTKKLLGRNMHQILGQSLDSPVLFVVCYTLNGEAIGGTGVALRCAQSRNIPVHNLHNPDTRDYIERIVSE